MRCGAYGLAWGDRGICEVHGAGLGSRGWERGGDGLLRFLTHVDWM